MNDLNFAQMQSMQKDLQDKYMEKWGGLPPEKAREKLLWMLAEAGEVADVIKKNGDRNILSDPAVRMHFVEEMCDVMMYFNDVLLCYGVTPDEFTQVYREKHMHNMGRW